MDDAAQAQAEEATIAMPVSLLFPLFLWGFAGAEEGSPDA